MQLFSHLITQSEQMWQPLFMQALTKKLWKNYSRRHNVNIIFLLKQKLNLLFLNHIFCDLSVPLFMQSLYTLHRLYIYMHIYICPFQFTITSQNWLTSVIEHWKKVFIMQLLWVFVRLLVLLQLFICHFTVLQHGT